MILYTILDPNFVLSNSNNDHQMAPNYTEMNIDGVMVQVSQWDDKDLRVERIISTDPFDYLNAKIQPGSIIKK